MDPDETLRRLRELVKETTEEPDNDLANEFADAFQALDEWLSKGGFSPWDTKPATMPGTMGPTGVREEFLQTIRADIAEIKRILTEGSEPGVC